MFPINDRPFCDTIISVQAPNSAVPGMEIIGHHCTAMHKEVIVNITIESILKLLNVPPFLQFETSYLPFCVNPCIRSSGPMDTHSLPSIEDFESPFQLALNRPPGPLQLPAEKIGPIIFYDDFVIRQERRVLR